MGETGADQFAVGRRELFVILQTGAGGIPQNAALDVVLDQVFFVHALIGLLHRVPRDAIGHQACLQLANDAPLAQTLVLEPGPGEGLGILSVVEVTVVFQTGNHRIDIACLLGLGAQFAPDLGRSVGTRSQGRDRIVEQGRRVELGPDAFCRAVHSGTIVAGVNALRVIL